MANKKADISIDQLLHIAESNKTAQKSNNLIKSISKTLPIKKIKGRSIMSKTDPNLNKKFKIKRINHKITAKVTGLVPELQNVYRAKILSTDYNGDTPLTECVGDYIFISKRELEITGRPA